MDRHVRPANLLKLLPDELLEGSAHDLHVRNAFEDTDDSFYDLLMR